MLNDTQLIILTKLLNILEYADDCGLLSLFKESQDIKPFRDAARKLWEDNCYAIFQEGNLLGGLENG